jgi:hypothetical protein
MRTGWTTPAKAAATLDDALALWHGTALADVTGAWFEEVRRSLEDQRLSAYVARNHAYLETGRHTDWSTTFVM